MQHKFFLKESFKHFTLLLLAHWLYISFLFTAYFVINGIHHSEKKRQTVIKSGYSLINTHTDKRKGNVFFSTPEFYLKLSELVPEVEAVVKSTPMQISFSYPTKDKVQAVEIEVPIYLVGSQYFDATNGDFLQGRAFNRSEVFSGKPYVVLTEGFLTKVFGDYDNSPSLIWINGIEYQVIGTWSFQSSDIIENESIFFPLGLADVFGKKDNTYINSFILKGEDSATLLKLKEGIDRIQLDAGLDPQRPEFSFSRPQVSKSTEHILSNNKIYVDGFIWLSFIIYIYFSISLNKKWLNFSERWSIWLFMLEGNSKSHGRLASETWLGVIVTSLVGGGLTSMLVLGFMLYSFRYTLYPGTDFHPSFFFYIFFFPVQQYLITRWAKHIKYQLQY